MRKFFQPKYSIKDGAYLYCGKNLEQSFLQANEYEIENYNFENVVKNENRLDEEDILLMSKTSENIISSIDFDVSTK